ncbi:TPR-like protein [Gymnopus androsaceus JB14]|uniref:TPR-like protein n=1 Tax=Gymnopus androsaceus JB14 TaxID=1447944 RepID=A0A6A4HHF8_9AGAR|nr:TPR-like protein [Gymnopus androsaceus JB14]
MGELGDIEKAIVALKKAVELTPDEHSEKPSRWSNLGIAFQSRFDHLGELSDMESAFVAKKHAVDLIPAGQAKNPRLLIALGNAYHSWFNYLGRLSDLESAIEAIKQAVELTPDGHADKPAWLNNLGVAFRSRFGHLGEIIDIDSAIAAQKEAVKLSPDSHPDKPSRLSNLGTAFQSRFGRLGDLSDIDSAIVVKKRAVELIPDGHVDKYRWLSNLGSAYESKFDRFGKLSDIESAIMIQKQAVKVVPDKHVDKPTLLNNLGNIYESRFRHLGDLGDIETAIMTKKQAVELTSDSHTRKPLRLNNLGNAYLSRFNCMRDFSDIERAIVTLIQAVELLPDGHIDKVTLFNNLGYAYLSQFGHSQNAIHHDSALSAFQRASLLSAGNPHDQLKAAIVWSNLCSTPTMALQAYTRFFELIPQVVWLGQTVSHRYEELPLIGRVISAATATAISAGNLPLAVEWLDEGRSIIWGQILQLRSPLDDLHDLHPKLAKELETVSRALDNAGMPTKNSSESMASGIEEATAEEEAQKHRKMAIRYEELIQQIRNLEGFTGFLKPKKLSELLSAAMQGPVIIVNVDESRCDALILLPSGSIIHVPLPLFSMKQAEHLHLKLVSSLHSSGVRFERNGDRAIRLALKLGDDHDHFALILEVLWSKVVQPILSKIAILHEYAEDSIPHVTWCPTGPLTILPLHAAGLYGDPPERNINASDFVVSSYTTTLRALIGSLPKLKQHLDNVPSMLIVSQPNTPGLSPLPGTLEEAKIIQKYTLSTHTCHLSHDAATAEAVMHKMSKYDLIHFACHGIQDMQNPLDSAFALYDQRLRLKSLMSLSLNNAQLAVLSACQTATGDENLPEEAVHLAAGMLAVGYPSVIATLWSIGDREAPQIADKLYANLLGNHGSYSREKKMSAAYALHKATKSLREEVGETNFVKWVPFIHLGT